jgi:hypothetical protein
MLGFTALVQLNKTLFGLIEVIKYLEAASRYCSRRVLGYLKKNRLSQKLTDIN